MAELVQLTDGIVNGMEVEVRGDVIGILVVCGVLHRAEIVDLFALWHDDHAARVLARGTFDARAGNGKAFFLRAGKHARTFFGILFHVAERGFICDGCDGAGLEDVFAAEQRLRIAVRTALVFAGEVEVDIRRFVAVKAEERLEWDGVAVAVEIFAAARALFRRQIKAGKVAAVRDELAVFALGANVVRLERVNLRDAGHGRDERRADGATRADEIAVRFAVCHELLRRHVQNGEAVLVDGAELAL